MPGTITTMIGPAAVWLAAFAEQLGIDAPSEAEVDAILALAGTAAHASERTAAPVACWLAARAGITPIEARELALGVTVPEPNAN